MSDIRLDDLYAVLVPVARRKQQLTYGELSQHYHQRTGGWYEPHGSWDAILGQLNRTLHAMGWPPLSAVVVNQETKEPEAGFWGDSPNVPARPANDLARIAVYGQLLRSVYEIAWPETLPLAPITAVPKTTALKGVIHGKHIELEDEPGLQDGEQITVTLNAASSSTSPSSPDALAALRRAAGAWAGDDEELDRYLEWNRQQRKGNRPEIPE